MRYIDFCGNEISQLGLGTSSFYSLDYIPDTIYAAVVHGGVNYIDTAYSYGNGDTIIKIGSALGYIPRDKYYIASKASLVEGRFTEDGLYRHLEHQTSRLRCGYLDYFMVHGLGYNIDNQLLKIKNEYPNFENSLDYIKAKGIAKHIGFSFDGFDHDLMKILNLYNWDFVMIRNNIISNDYRASLVPILQEYKKEHPNFGIMNMEIFEHGLLCDLKYTDNIKTKSQSFIIDSFVKSGMPFICGVSSTKQLKQLINIYNEVEKYPYDDSFAKANIDRILEYVKDNKFYCCRCHLCDGNLVWPNFSEFLLAYAKYIHNDRKGMHLKSLLNNTDLDKISNTLKSTNDNSLCDYINANDFIEELKKLKKELL